MAHKLKLVVSGAREITVPPRPERREENRAYYHPSSSPPKASNLENARFDGHVHT